MLQDQSFNSDSQESMDDMAASSGKQEGDAAPLYSAESIDLQGFNALKGSWQGGDVEDMNRLFVREIALDDDTVLEAETIKVPGFIGISDELELENTQGERVYGHRDISKFLARDGLLICTFQWHKEMYGVPFYMQEPTALHLPKEANKPFKYYNQFMDGFIKNYGSHTAAIVPGQRMIDEKQVPAFAAIHMPACYHEGMYSGEADYYPLAVAQRLVFSDCVTREQAHGYTNSIMCWMMLLNAFAQFPDGNINGGDPTQVGDRNTLKTFLKNGVLASLGDEEAIAFFQDPNNRTYCAEFHFINLNTPLYPFNKAGLTRLLDGDVEKAEAVLAIQTDFNNEMPTVLTDDEVNPNLQNLGNVSPQVLEYNIKMPLVPEDLPPLDELMAEHNQTVEANSLPFPPFTIAQVIRRAFRTLLPSQSFEHHPELVEKLAKAQAQMLCQMEPVLMAQLQLDPEKAENAPLIAQVKQHVEWMSQQFETQVHNYNDFQHMVDVFIDQADAVLVGQGGRDRYVPPRVFVDLGQADGDENLPKGWGFTLETVGALVDSSVIKAS